MGLSSALTDPVVPLVADASTIINIVCSGSAAEILSALPNRVVVVDHIPAELELGRARGRVACDGQKALVAAGAIEVVGLPDHAASYFEELVIGAAVDTLDDGEAATIAYALTSGAIALVDERKATRICAERFPKLNVLSTVDVLVHTDVQARLGTARLQEAVFLALRDGRMGVLSHHLDWVLSTIGPERAAACASLPMRVRGQQSHGSTAV